MGGGKWENKKNSYFFFGFGKKFSLGEKGGSGGKETNVWYTSKELICHHLY